MSVSFVAAEKGELSCPDLSLILNTRYSVLSSSREYVADDVTMDICEAVVAALEAIG